MSAICLIDTSILVEILNVPRKAERNEEILAELETRIKNKETLFLPMATILETGNHIAQNGDGNQRRSCAKKFVALVRKALSEEALNGKSPLKPISFLTETQLQQWLNEFPESAMRGSGLGDLSIVHDFNRICSQNPRKRVYIWSLDGHLSSHCQETGF